MRKLGFVVGMFLVMLFIPSSQASAASEILITEFLVDPADGCDSTDGEWVELYNNTSNEINLSVYEICDLSSCDTLPSYTLSPGKVVIVMGDEIAKSDCGLSNVPVIGVGAAIGSGLNNSGDTISIQLDGGGAVSDSVTYGGTGICVPGDGESAQRSPISPSGTWSCGVPTLPSPTAITLTEFSAGTVSQSTNGLLLVLLCLGGSAWIIGKREQTKNI